MSKFAINMGRPAIVLSVCSLCLILLVLYTGLDTSGSFRFQEREGFMDYGMLAEAFVSGQLHLKQPVDPERLISPDPLDPSTPYPYMWDAIIWNGKYYFQHEPLPGVIRAILLYTTGLALPTGAVVVTFTLGVFILQGALLWMMRRRYFPESPTWMFWYVWISFGVSGVQLYIASRPMVHNEAVAAGCFFMLAGSTLLVHALSDERHSLIVAAMAGTCFGAAVACRALLILYPACFLLIFLIFAAIRRESIKTTIHWTLSFGGPMVLCVAALLAYNYLRFGDPLDFGRLHMIVPRYQQYLYVIVGGHYFSWKHIPYQLYYYVLSLPLIVNRFPFLRYPFGAFWNNGIYLHREAVCSIFAAMPVLLLSLPFPFLFKRIDTKDRLSLILLFFGVSCLAILVVLSFSFGAVARYYYDFTPILFVLAFCNLAVFWDRIATDHRRKTLARVVLSLVFMGNAFMGLLLGLTGAIIP